MKLLQRRPYAIATAIAALTLAATSHGAEELRELPAAVSPHLATAQLLNAAGGDESLPMSITLRLRHRDELEALLAAQHRPGSADYHRWLSPDEFAARFGAPQETYDALANWLRDRGFAVQTLASRTRIEFSGTVVQVQSAFSVRMNAYRHRGRRALANADPPLLPARFAADVESVRLNTFRLADPVVTVVGTNDTITALGPADAYTAYNVTPVLEQGIDGSGQTIAIAARSDFHTSDVTNFQQFFGVPVRAPVKVFPGRNPGVGAPNGVCAGISNPNDRSNCIFGEQVEVLLDVEWASAMAPGATVLVDISSSDIDVSLAHIVSKHSDAKIVSVSFGLCERLDPTVVQTLGPIYMQAASQGQTVLVAAGNNGADGCDDRKSAGVNGLGSFAEVTVVGGTQLDPGFDANGDATGRVSEEVWNDVNGASGGGVSTLAAKPMYQRGPGVPDDGARDQPDVTLMASPTHVGYFMFAEGGLLLIGGTSAATPSWGGIVALANQANAAEGSGIINYALYALGAKQYAESGQAVFHDITVGDNSFDGVAGFAAGPGYDLASGLGTPDVAALVQALGPQECAGDCNADGMISTDELVAAVHIALGLTPLSRCESLDTDHNGRVTVNELVGATSRAVHGC